MNYDIQQLPNLLPSPDIYYEARIDSEDSTPSDIDYFISAFPKDISFNKERDTRILQRPLESEFDRLAKQWRKETGFHSSLSKKFMHPAYQRIMAMGERALPLILRELQQRPAHWFYALQFIAGEKGKDVAQGVYDLEEVRSAWLQWGYEHNYI